MRFCEDFSKQTTSVKKHVSKNVFLNVDSDITLNKCPQQSYLFNISCITKRKCPIIPGTIFAR
jgi:hypothetical protein